MTPISSQTSRFSATSPSPLRPQALNAQPATADVSSASFSATTTPASGRPAAVRAMNRSGELATPPAVKKEGAPGWALWCGVAGAMAHHLRGGAQPPSCPAHGLVPIPQVRTVIRLKTQGKLVPARRRRGNRRRIAPQRPSARAGPAWSRGRPIATVRRFSAGVGRREVRAQACRVAHLRTLCMGGVRELTHTKRDENYRANLSKRAAGGEAPRRASTAFSACTHPPCCVPTYPAACQPTSNCAFALDARRVPPRGAVVPH